MLALRHPALVICLALLAGLGAAVPVWWHLDAQRQAAAASRVHTLATTMALPRDAVPVPVSECADPAALRCLRTSTGVDLASADLLATLGRQASIRPTMSCQSSSTERRCTVELPDGRHGVLVTVTAEFSGTGRPTHRTGRAGTTIAIATR